MSPPKIQLPAPAIAQHLRLIGERAFSRTAGAPLVAGNAVELLIDGRANFDAWLVAIREARESILLENYIFGDDELTRTFREALTERARAGVRVCLVRDWLGCVGETRASFWRPLVEAGGKVRTYNPPSLSSPSAWISRDHRKLLVVDGAVAFVSGVCLSGKWLGDPARGVEPWRDTGVAIRGPAVREVATAFAENWARLGAPLPADLAVLSAQPPVAGETALRIVATLPNTSGLYRLDQMVASLARRTLWLTDAYFVGVAPYVQALVAAARDGVDVRLLVPGTSDLAAVGSLSRAGYRPLLEGGVRVFEWNGSMLHAKTAVADGTWARVGSSNLNVASWMGNCEIDVAIEDERLGRQMQEQYELDLRHATEIVLHVRRVRRCEPCADDKPCKGHQRRGGSSRAAASALRLANTVGAAFTQQRALGPSESGVLLGGAALFAGLTAIAFLFPRLIAWPMAVLALWSALSLLARALSDRRERRHGAPPRPGLPAKSESESEP